MAVTCTYVGAAILPGNTILPLPSRPGFSRLRSLFATSFEIDDHLGYHAAPAEAGTPCTRAFTNFKVVRLAKWGRFYNKGSAVHSFDST